MAPKALMNQRFAVADLVDLVYEKGDADGAEMKQRLNEEASKYLTIRQAVASVRRTPGDTVDSQDPRRAYDAARTLVALCLTADEDASENMWLNQVVKPFEQDAVEALIGEDQSGQINAVLTGALESLESLLASGHPGCMEALAETQQSADAEGLALGVGAFQYQQEMLQSVQQTKTNAYKLFKDPTVEVALAESLRQCGEMKRVPVKSIDDLNALRTSLSEMHLTSDVNLNGNFIAKGAQLLTADAYLVHGENMTLKSFDLVRDTAPEGPFWVMASFKESFSEALLHGEQKRLEDEYDKLEVGLAEDLQAGVENLSCKTWEAGTVLMSQVQLVCLKIEEIKAIRDEFMPTACKHAEDARQFHQQLDTIQDIFTAALNNLAVRSEECEQVDTDAIFMVMEAQRENQEQLAAFLNTFEKNRCKLAQRNLLFCYKDALQQKQAWFQKKVDQSGLQSARRRVEELLTTTTTPSTLAADITQGLQDTAGCAASAFRRAQQKLDICLERSLSGRQQVLEAEQQELDGIEVELPPLEEAVKQGRKKMIALRKMQGERQMCEKRKESLEMQQAITRQLKGNLQVVADELPEIGDAAGDDIQNEADQLLPVFVAVEPEPCATTTLSTCGPDLATLVAMEVAKQLAKEREKIFANGLKEGLKQAAAMNQDWIQCGEGEGA